MFNAKKLIFVIAVALFSQAALASMVVERSIVSFEPDKSNRQDIEVKNTGEEMLYIQVEPFQVINPGTEEEERVPVVNPKEAQFLATPSKLAIPPNSSKLVRLVNLESGL